MVVNHEFRLDRGEEFKQFKPLDPDKIKPWNRIEPNIKRDIIWFRRPLYVRPKLAATLRHFLNITALLAVCSKCAV